MASFPALDLAKTLCMCMYSFTKWLVCFTTLTRHCYIIVSFRFQVPGFPAWFNVVYDQEQEAVYTYQLHSDLGQGDLELLVD